MLVKKLLLFLLIWMTAASWLRAQRLVQPLNNGWQFKKEVDAHWQPVTLPHTWNREDVMDDVPGYYRGIGWYRFKLVVNKAWKGKEIYLYIGAANQEATVLVNGKKAGEHTGGYTAFQTRISPLLNEEGENELLVKVNNSHNRNIPPLSADFTFFGGMYRQASLVILPPVHFSANEKGSKGVFITTPTVTGRSATVHVKAIISNNKTTAETVKLTTTVYDAKGKKIAENIGTATLQAGADKSIEQDMKAITLPRLWSPGDPYLYKAVTRITNSKTGAVLDEVTNPLGFRWFRFDGAQGFFLNGKPLKLVGASRHQDRKGLGNAVPAALARKDVALLKEMGANFLRVAHYPQDPAVLQACDELGILTSVEIPIVNEITESDSFYRNCEAMQVEMIKQYYNHPSIIMWCYMNEVLLRPQFNNDKPRQKIYFANIAQLARNLDSITRKEDPTRHTMIAHNGNYNPYKDAGLVDIPQVVGWNLYQGWYGPSLQELPAFLDRYHKDYPDKPVMVTEYGADADPRIRSQQPVRFDKSVEYTTLFHQYYWKEIIQRPYVAAAMIWNLADFNSETRNESMPHINNKGLLEWDRTPKDPYYYYKAMLDTKPFIKILGAPLRGGMADSGTATSHQTIQVASNAEDVSLTINGQLQGTQPVANGIAEWRVPFKNGINIIHAKATRNGMPVQNVLWVECRLQAYQIQDGRLPFKEVNILLGAKRFFTDHAGYLWIPGQPYRKGSWGHVGGTPFKIPNNNRLPYGSDKNIVATSDDPIYQTQQTGIEEYRFDVPAGNYQLTLHFAELEGGEGSFLLYNLADTVKTKNESIIKRVFDVSVNGQPLLQNFNMMQDYGAARPIIKTTKLNITGSTGITVSFTAVEGAPVLNAIQLKKYE